MIKWPSDNRSGCTYHGYMYDVIRGPSDCIYTFLGHVESTREAIERYIDKFIEECAEDLARREEWRRTHDPK